ncbi:MAG: class II aldolase/adducin family protein [bacterium]|nr:class II aldolase/adducin family protein [bacterium]
MVTEYQAKLDIVEIGRRMYSKGFVASNDGNISIRISEKEILATPSGLSKGFLTPDQLIKCDMLGNKIAGDPNLKPSSEIKMHCAVYMERPDITAVVHAHPPVATGFAVAGIPLEKCVLPEIILTIGSIPLAQYGTPSTEEVPNSIRDLIKQCDAVLLANHGALTVGKDVYNAYYKMESLEHFAKISLAARQLGGEKVLTAPQVEKLMAVRQQMGITGPVLTCKGAECAECGICDTEEMQERLRQKQQQLWHQAKSVTTETNQTDANDLIAKITEEVVRRIVISK